MSEAEAVARPAAPDLREIEQMAVELAGIAGNEIALAETRDPVRRSLSMDFGISGPPLPRRTTAV
jgi:hypothetical protein